MNIFKIFLLFPIGIIKILFMIIVVLICIPLEVATCGKINTSFYLDKIMDFKIINQNFQ